MYVGASIYIEVRVPMEYPSEGFARASPGTGVTPTGVSAQITWCLETPTGVTPTGVSAGPLGRDQPTVP